MDYTNFGEVKADEYRYWRSRPVHERIDAVEEINQAAYGSKLGDGTGCYQDYKDLLSALHAHGVKYLIAGGLRGHLYA